MGYDVNIIVVDGHSKDHTQEIAAEKGAQILHQKGRGKGHAIQTAFQAFDGDYLFMMDADGTYPANRLVDMFPYLESGRSDVVVGTREVSRPGPVDQVLVGREGRIHALAGNWLRPPRSCVRVIESAILRSRSSMP